MPAPPISGFTSTPRTEPAPSGGGGITADALARQLGFEVGSPSPSPDGVVRREFGGSSTLTDSSTTTSSGPTASTPTGSRRETQRNESEGYVFPFDLNTIVGTRDFVQWLAENLGDRIMRDLELRGGRFRGGS
jgi:hypothetical protein